MEKNLANHFELEEKIHNKDNNADKYDEFNYVIALLTLKHAQNYMSTNLHITINQHTISQLIMVLYMVPLFQYLAFYKADFFKQKANHHHQV